jgi:hypothetical protein
MKNTRTRELVILVLLGLAGTIAPRTKGQTWLTSGLVAYYPFRGNANDASRHGHNGIVSNATLTIDRFGNPNNAYSFNGTNAFIVIPNDPAFNLSSNYTVSLWFLQNTGDVHRLIDKETAGFDDGWEMDVGQGGGSFLRWVAGAPLTETYTTSECTLQQWHQIIVSVSGGSARLTLDGTPNGTGTCTANRTNMLDVFIGKAHPTTGAYQDWFLDGSIDDIRIYNRALNDSEAQQLYQYESQSCSPRRAEATTEIAGGIVVGATIDDGGCGYTNAPAVLILGGGGNGATATATVSNGLVVGVTITAGGTGYTSIPQIYIYSPFGLQVGLLKAVKPSFSDLLVGTNYQLQVSGDLISWTNHGSSFTATNPVMAYPIYFDTDDWNQLFFRLQVVP